MPDDLEIRVFQLNETGQDEILNFLTECGDRADSPQGFCVTDFRDLRYFEFAKLPDHEPILRVRAVDDQLLVEDREELPAYIHDRLKYECIAHTVFKTTRMPLSEFTAKHPEAKDTSSMEVEVEYDGD